MSNTRIMYILPPFFHFVFATLEPISTYVLCRFYSLETQRVNPNIYRVAGFIYPYISPAKFLAEQIPPTPSQITAITPNVESTILQLANCYLLLSMCSTAVLRTTNEKAVVRNFLIALLLGDIGHLYVHVKSCFFGLLLTLFHRYLTWTVMGTELFFDPTQWNALTGGNVGFTVLQSTPQADFRELTPSQQMFFLLNRTLYLIGWGGSESVTAKNKTK